MSLRVEVRGRDAVVSIGGADVVWALSSGFTLPVARAEVVDRRTVRSWRRWRLAGTSVPGLVVAGRFGPFFHVTDFYLFHRAKRLLALYGAPGAKYERVVLEVPDPDATAALFS